MQRYQNKHSQAMRTLLGLVLAVNLSLPLFARAAAVTSPLDLATIPLANSPTIKIQPNLLFVLDDSGSMDWNYLPDWANDSLCRNTTAGSFNRNCTDQPPYRSSDFNAIYYNPAITYTPAVNASGGKVNTSGDSKGSQTTWTSVKNDAYNVQSTSSTNLLTDYTDVEWCTSTAYTDCLRNDNYVLPGTVNGKNYTISRPSVKSTGSGLVATGSLLAPTTAARSYGPHYYNIIPGEFCDSAKLTDCQLTQTAIFKYPAKVRWCKATTGPSVSAEANATSATPAPGVCQSTRVGAYSAARYPTKFFQPAVAYAPAVPAVPATAAVAPSNGTLVITQVDKNQTVSLRCGGTFIGRSNTFTSSNSNTASTRLNTLYNTINGTNVNGYGIACTKSPNTSSPSSLSCTISAPAGASACSGGFTVDNNIDTTTNTGPSGGTNANPGSPYIPEVLAQSAGFPGSFVRVDIVTGNSYPKAITRTDCAGATGPTGCSYTEEMTNFANWWTYYQTRMQTMKTAASLAFKDIGEDFRVGFMTIHPASGTSVRFDTFNPTHKTAWYNKFFSINPGSATPLRSALAKAGRIYANKETIGGTFEDPVEYACQQNFTLLTTDGFWNTDSESDVMKVDGTQIGNQDDSPTLPPFYEGATASTNSLADVAKYYHDTDIRTAALGNCPGALNTPGTGVCSDPAPSTANQRQNMVTLTLGLGVDGELAYTTDYKKAATGDFAEIKAGNLNWPKPVQNAASAIDDLWHAAVNGDGSYFSARSPTELASQLKEALASIKVKVGAGAAAATSTLNPVAGDNFAYVASYTSGNWTGNLEKREIDVTTGAVNVAAVKCVEDVPDTSSCNLPSTVAGTDCVTTGVTDPLACPSPGVLDGTSCKVPMTISCAGTLKGQLYSSRTIKMKSGSSLVNFNYANISAVGLGATFEKPFLETNLTQWPDLAATRTSAELVADVAGNNLVNYLRGDTSHDEGAADPADKLYRKRQAILGDAVNSKPAFIGKPTFSYTDPGYENFKTTGIAITRDKMVYMGANDGMLHAFDADTMEERWAYVPTMVIRDMWKLADAAYSGKHTFYVDGDPIISDICVSSCDTSSAVWKTILVGGLNSGGRGYYALNITDPANPSLLWEFDANTEPNLGYTFGTPVVTKRPSDGKWVVLLTSGYNNIPDNNAFYGLSTTKFKPFISPATPQYTSGDGRGYLYVLDADTGSKLAELSTGIAGDITKPNGLAKIKAFSEDSEKNNTTTYVYGGDLLGNVWRFNIADNSVLKFTTLEVSGITQPITTRPELGLINNKRIIYVGTGKYLEVSDLVDTSTQTLYAIKDDTVTTLVDPRSLLVEQKLINSGPINRISEVNAGTNTTPFATDLGWYVDFPESSERQNVSSQLVLGTLLVPTTVPTSSACQPAGHGWFNAFDFKTGLAVVTANGIVSSITSSPPVGFNVVYIGGKPKVSIVTADDPTPKLIDAPFSGSGVGFQKKRAIWRELTQ
ncbi:MAG: PilC/PilY family type IV pilus protein [Methylotenera sp.]|nr:PilC/PilY family type IV pilus protein [Methylotenera sp.]